MRRLARPLLYFGTFAIVLGLGRIHAEFIGHYYFHSSSRLPWTLAYAGLLDLAAYAAGLPDLARSRRESVTATVGAVVAGAAGISVVQLTLGSLLLPRFVVGSSMVLLVPWYSFCTLISGVGRGRAAGRDRVIAVVSAAEAEGLRSELAISPEKHASLVAALRPEEARPAGERSRPLLEAVVGSRASLIILNRDAQADDQIVAQAATLHESGVRVRTLSLFYDEWLGKLPVSELERVSLLFDIGEIHSLRYVRAKRIVDVGLGLCGIGLLIPVSVVVLVGNLFGNRGTLWFRQPRVGRNGALFDIWKFRSMRTGSQGLEWTSEGDDRVTTFGRWLRRTHLDELPQVINVLRGDLSVVGPRPEQPQYVAELRQKIPFYDLRQRVRPGLTGWAQVKYSYGSSELDAIQKLQYEFFYLRHQSLLLDMRIIGRTIRSVVGRGGR